MRKKKISEEQSPEESPQLSLEKILKTEIEIAQSISEAREKAEKTVDSARDEVGSLKENIINQARVEREESLTKRIDAANQRSKEKLASAKEHSEIFSRDGEKFIDDAVQMVIDMVLMDERDG